MTNVQGFISAINDSARQTRSQYHLTLGDMITLLQKCDSNKMVLLDIGGSLGQERSYRGYYSDLAFQHDQGQVKSAGEVLAQCQTALGQKYEGYKGGDFVMGEDTPLWIAGYGIASGIAVIGMSAGQNITLTTKYISD